MGRYIAIGVVKIATSQKDHLRRAEVPIDEWSTVMKIDRHYDPSIFDFVDQGANISLVLKDRVIEEQLLRLLESFYPKFYAQEQEKYITVLQKIRSTPPEEWLALSRKRIGEMFQADDSPDSEMLFFENNPIYQSIEVKTRCIQLSVEGKISTEGIDDHLNFFKYCIQEAFPKFPIAKSLRVYTTG